MFLSNVTSLIVAKTVVSVGPQQFNTLALEILLILERMFSDKASPLQSRKESIGNKTETDFKGISGNLETGNVTMC